ncbi:MAG: cytochrome P460 family protein, partial [Gammaproteobacteria bacterium]|nr:cytochrome P460 family protein [Gammaproteobacteria bacterium]
MSDGDWHFLPGWEGRKEGQAPHGAGIITYVNDVGYQAALQKKSTLPEHTIVVKENYAPAVEGNKQSALWPNAKLAVVTVMYKVKGFNPEANDWYWVKYLPDGSVDEMKGMKLAGKPKGCIQCHASGGGKKND